jgi:hypothetical protein
MIRIRYIGAHLIAPAFEHTFRRDPWGDQHGLESRQIDGLAPNPKFDVEVPGKPDGSNAPLINVRAMSDATR